MVAPRSRPDPPPAIDLSVVIPAFGARELLQRCLAAVEHELARAGLDGASEIIVADDATPDGLGAELLERHPRVRCLVARRRRGFAVNANRGVHAARGEVVCLLNTDMVVLPGFFDGCLAAFEDRSLFALTGQILEPSGTNAGRKSLALEGTSVVVTESRAGDTCSLRHGSSPYANGGGSFFRRSTFLKLGGFDRAFSPFYWEDTDLGYRAWKRGYWILYDPTRAVAHDHQGTIGRLHTRVVRRVYQRNRRRFVWHNNTSLGLASLFRETNLRPMLHALARLRVRGVVRLLAEVRFLPRAAAARRSMRRSQVIGDADLARLWLDEPRMQPAGSRPASVSALRRAGTSQPPPSASDRAGDWSRDRRLP